MGRIRLPSVFWRTNAISPGSIVTPRLSDLLASSETGEQRKKMISTMVPLGRLGKLR
jgi:NAD(P)-dependent dehydrogenase (short-subunit alcohol dehydrogenase family)